MLSLLKFLATMIIALIPAMLLYRWVIYKQYLVYEKSINKSLIVLGGLCALLTMALRHILNMAFLQDLGLGGMSKYITPIIMFETLVKLWLIYALVVKKRNYINNYDIVIFSLCVGLGFGIADNIIKALFLGSLETTLLAFESIVIQLAYQSIMAHFIVLALKHEDKKRPYYTLAFIAPMLLQVFFEISYQSKSMGMLALNSIAFIVIIALSIWSIDYNAKYNKRFEGVNPDEVLERNRNRKTLKQRSSYFWDLLFSKGNGAIFLLLFLTSAAITLIVGAILYKNSPKAAGGTFGKALWVGFMRLLDQGNVAPDMDTGDPNFVLVTITATILGVIVTSSLIGIIINAFDKKLHALRNGNSKVLEKHHILIIGYNSNALKLIVRLINTRPNNKRLSIVILSPSDKQSLEDKIHREIGHPSKVKIICRKGEGYKEEALNRVSAKGAREVVILGDDDSLILKSAIAVQKNRGSNDITLILNDGKNLDLCKRVLGDEANCYTSGEMSFEPIIKATEGLDYVKLYREFATEKSNIIIKAEKFKKLVGKNFASVIGQFWHNTVLGLANKEGIVLNPNPMLNISPEDSLIFLNSDNKRPRYGRKPLVKDPVDISFKANETAAKLKNLTVVGGEEYNLQNKLNNVDIRHIAPENFNGELNNISKDNTDILLIFTDGFKDIIPLLINIHSQVKPKPYIIVSSLNHDDLKFAYDHNLIDLTLQLDMSRTIAGEIYNEDDPAYIVEKQLFSHKGIKLVPALNLFDKKAYLVEEVYSACYEIRLLCLGYIKDGKAILNPNKNQSIAFNEGDILLLIRETDEE